MDLQLKDKIIIVTGGAKGIGEGIVKALAKEGAFPVIIGRSQEDNLATVEAIKAEGGKAAQVVAELSVCRERSNTAIWKNRWIGQQCRCK